MVTEIAKASPRQIREVLNLLVSGVTSDASSMEEIAGSWWRRFLFMRWFGPRFLGKQMDTFVSTKGDRIIGFVIVQYDGDAAGTFDWAFTEPLEVKENREDFADLIDSALDYLEDQGIHPYFYFGFATSSPPAVKQVLDDLGLRSADYQNTQMVGDLPLAEDSPLPEGFRLSAQISARFSARMADLLPSVYPGADAEEVAMIASIHSSTLRSSKVFLIMDEEDEVGFVQQFRWRDELRLLLALSPKLWGTDTERQLVAHLAQTLQGQTQRLRLRSFSQGHLEKARQSFVRLGLGYQPAPWQRWVVALEANELDDEPSDSDRRTVESQSVWPQQTEYPEGNSDDGPAEQPVEDDKSESHDADDKTN